MNIELKCTIFPKQEMFGEAYKPQTYFECCKVCPNFSNTWSCPPLPYTAEELMADFSEMLLTAFFLHFSEEERRDIRGSEATEFARSRLRRVKNAALASLVDMEHETPGSLAFSFGSCSLCEHCTRPSGKPCIHPETLRHSLEALGFDLGYLLKEHFGRDMLWAKHGLPPYFVLLGGIGLKPAAASNLRKLGQEALEAALLEHFTPHYEKEKMQDDLPKTDLSWSLE